MGRRVRLRTASAAGGHRAEGDARLDLRHGRARREDALRAGRQPRRRTREPAHRPRGAAGAARARPRPRHRSGAVVPAARGHTGRRRRDDEADREAARRGTSRSTASASTWSRARCPTSRCATSARSPSPSAPVSSSGRRCPSPAIVYPAVQLEVLNTTLWPDFPYKGVDRYVDLWMPMSYYTYRDTASGLRSAYLYTVDSVDRLRKRVGDPDVPVHLIGGLAEDSTPDDYLDMTRAARATDALGWSVYDYATTGSWAWPYLRNQVPVPTTAQPPTTPAPTTAPPTRPRPPPRPPPRRCRRRPRPPRPERTGLHAPRPGAGTRSISGCLLQRCVRSGLEPDASGGTPNRE